MGHSEPKLPSQKPCPYQADRRVHYAPGCTGGQADNQAEYWPHVAQRAGFLLLCAQHRQPCAASRPCLLDPKSPRACQGKGETVCKVLVWKGRRRYKVLENYLENNQRNMEILLKRLDQHKNCAKMRNEEKRRHIK